MDYTHDNLTLVGLHVPDTNGGPFPSMEAAEAAGHDTLNPVTGTYQIGVVIEGAFVPIISEKASLIADAIALAKRTGPTATQPPVPASPFNESQPEQAAAPAPTEQAPAASVMQTGEQPTPPEQPAG